MIRSVGQRSVSKVKPILYMLGKGGISVLQTAILSSTVFLHGLERFYYYSLILFNVY